MTKRTFRILHPWLKPKGVLTWQTASEKWHRLQNWRQLMFKRHGRSARVLRVTWILADLFRTKEGFAFPSNAYLAKAARMREHKVEEVLAILDRAKSIVRVHCEIDRRMQRRIYPAGRPPISGGKYPPKEVPPKRGDRISKERERSAAVADREAIHANAEDWRRRGCHEEIDPKDEPTNKGG